MRFRATGYPALYTSTDAEDRRSYPSATVTEGTDIAFGTRSSVVDVLLAVVRSNVRGTVRGTVRNTVRGTVRGTVRSTVRGTVCGTVRGTVRSTVRGTVRGSLFPTFSISSKS